MTDVTMTYGLSISLACGVNACKPGRIVARCLTPLQRISINMDSISRPARPFSMRTLPLKSLSASANVEIFYSNRDSRRFSVLSAHSSREFCLQSKLIFTDERLHKIASRNTEPNGTTESCKRDCSTSPSIIDIICHMLSNYVKMSPPFDDSK